MDTRLTIAYALMLFLALGFVSIIFFATRAVRARRRSDRLQRRERRRARASA